jgi:uncharacterized membrane protein (DUF485 family)
MVEETTAQQHEAYERIHASRDFIELKRRYVGFAFPMTVAFMVWYLLYVVASNWANDFMETQVIGNVNVALVFGLLQFVSTFLIAWLYARHANRKLDPIADRLREEFDREVDR